MEIFTLYVGQGDLTVIVGDQEAVIVDCHLPSRADPAGVHVGQALSEILTRRGQPKRLVGLILTGFDNDHAAPRGVSMIVNRYMPSWVLYPSYFHDTDAAAAVFGAIDDAVRRRRDTRWGIHRIGVSLDRLGSRVFDNLTEEWAFEIFSPHAEDMNSSNNASLVAKVSPKLSLWEQVVDTSTFSYLITGDTQIERWDRINRLFGSSLQSDVMSAPHHGADNGANSETISLVNPEQVLVSAGRGNQHGHPGRSALRRYRAGGAEVHVTAREGSLRTYRGGILGGLVTEQWTPGHATTEQWWW